MGRTAGLHPARRRPAGPRTGWFDPPDPLVQRSRLQPPCLLGEFPAIAGTATKEFHSLFERQPGMLVEIFEHQLARVGVAFLMLVRCDLVAAHRHLPAPGEHPYAGIVLLARGQRAGNTRRS